jgi:hypothetical protein
MVSLRWRFMGDLNTVTAAFVVVSRNISPLFPNRFLTTYKLIPFTWNRRHHWQIRLLTLE